jgi:hypothetical protein
MLRPVSTSSASASVAPAAVRGAAAAEIATDESRASVANVVSPAARQSNPPEPSAIFRYNSFEFVYRQDIGRIVLVGQSPETGERVVQVPSEQVLRAYERTVRAEKALAKPQDGSAPPDKGTSSAPAASSTPQLAQTLAAAVGIGGGDGSSGLVSLSA